MMLHSGVNGRAAAGDAVAGEVDVLPRVAIRAVVSAVLLSLASPASTWEQGLGEDSVEDDELIARIPVCFDFGCARRTQIHVYQSDFSAVETLLRASSSAADERRRLAQAVALMEKVAAERTPTGQDLARNDFDERTPDGQMDCIDESTNTSVYLDLFASRGLLRWHEVLERAYRAPALLDEHWSAQIREVHAERRYAVDSWVRANGEPAVIQALEDWKRKLPPS
jgi:hypothetical protein